MTEIKLERYKYYYVQPGALCLAVGDDVVHIVSTGDIVCNILSWEVPEGPMTPEEAHKRFPQYTAKGLKKLIEKRKKVDRWEVA